MIDSIAVSTSEREPGIWRILGVLIALLNLVLAALAGLLEGMELAVVTGYVIGGALFWPCVVVALFNIGKRFRNSRSRWKIFFWTSCFSLLSIVGSLGRSLSEVVQASA